VFLGIARTQSLWYTKTKETAMPRAKMSDEERRKKNNERSKKWREANLFT